MLYSLRPYIVFLFFLFFVHASVKGQLPIEEIESKKDLISYIREQHGPDQGIINGKLYYNKYYRIQKHPYFNEESAHNGTVTLFGKRYPDVRINYNIYAQSLVMEYEGMNGGIYKINLSPVHTDAFELEEYHFEKLVLDDREPTFYQVIRADGISCFIHWSKEVLVSTNNTQYADFFSDPKRTYFLGFNGRVHSFKNRKTFSRPFSIIPPREINKYMRTHKISFRNSTPEQIESLLKFVSSNIQSKSLN